MSDLSVATRQSFRMTAFQYSMRTNEDRMSVADDETSIVDMKPKKAVTTIPTY